MPWPSVSEAVFHKYADGTLHVLEEQLEALEDVYDDFDLTNAVGALPQRCQQFTLVGSTARCFDCETANGNICNQQANP